MTIIGPDSIKITKSPDEHLVVTTDKYGAFESVKKITDSTNIIDLALEVLAENDIAVECPHDACDDNCESCEYKNGIPEKCIHIE